MSKFDELMLEIHKEAKKLAFEDVEKKLMQDKDFKALERLEDLRKNDSQ